MKIGVTATRKGITHCQKAYAREFMKQELLDRHVQMVHGDCIGGDSELHDIAEEVITKDNIIIRPPTDPRYRAFKKGGLIHTPKPYINRDHDIVDECDILLAFPKAYSEELRSGTWATIRYARKVIREYKIVWPDASLSTLFVR